MNEKEKQIAELIIKMKSTPYYGLVHELTQQTVASLLSQMFVPYDKKPLYCDATYGQIVSHRQGRIEGASLLIQTMERLEKEYKKEKVEKIVEGGENATA